jgi:hypothetical protein
LDFGVNFSARTALFAAALFAVTLPVKLATLPPRLNATAEMDEKAVAVRAFIASHGGINHLATINGARQLHWPGFDFRYGVCRAIVLPNTYGQEGSNLLKHGLGLNMQTMHIYRGRFSDRYPRLQIAIDNRLLWALRPGKWRHSLSLILLTAGDCDPILRWNWEALWT